MKWGKLLVALMAVECLGATIAYAYQGNYKLALYWLFATGINSVVYTF